MDRPKTLVLISPTRFGKTQWARSLGEHVFWSGLVNLSTFRESAQYIVFDDVDFEFLPNYKSWFGAQKTFNATDKYTKKKVINFGKPCIFLCNPDNDPRDKAKPGAYPWLADNCVFISLVEKLFI